MAAVCLAASAGGCGDDDSEGTRASLHGTVRDAESGKRLSGASVSFVSDTLDEADDKSDGQGKFALVVHSRTPLGRLTALRAGYATRVVSVFLDDGDVGIDIEMSPK